MKLICLVFFILTGLNSCKCFYYYSYSKDEASIKGGIFQIESRINSYPKGENDQLEIAIYYQDSLQNKIVRNSVKIYTVVSDHNDTLKFNNEYAGHYYFTFYKQWPEKIDITFLYDMDSLGIISHKFIFLKNLIKNKNCEFKPATH